MAFQRPTLAELVTRAQADAVSRLTGAGAVLRRSLVSVLSRVTAGATHTLHGHLDFISKQVFPDVSEDEFLVRHASLYGLSQRAPEFASGSVVVTGVEDTVIPSGLVLVRADGAEYTTTSGATVTDGAATLEVTADLADSNSNCDADTELTFSSPLAGVDAVATVAAGGLSGGSDLEEVEDLRARLLARMQTPPQGGADPDYVAWALEVPGVTRAWVYPAELGLGTVTVRFMRDGDEDPFPDAGAITEVQDYIDVLRPVTAVVTVVAPIDAPKAFTMHLTPDTSATRAAVTAELTDLIERTARPHSAVSPVIIPISQIRGAISDADGVTDYSLATPTADLTFTAGQLASLGTVTFT